MRISTQNTTIANQMRKMIHDQTDTISDGEGIAMILLWGFLSDHATAHGFDVSDLARDQLEAFIMYAEKNLKMVREH